MLKFLYIINTEIEFCRIFINIDKMYKISLMIDSEYFVLFFEAGGRSWYQNR
jgi:hypothetical protein